MISLTAERLRQALRYCQTSGKFYSVTGNRPGARVAQPAGHVEANGYRRIMIDGRRYLAHRLAWFYVTANWPEPGIDHINGDRDDNRVTNLRLATRSQNSANTRPTNPTGLKGAHYNRFRGYWQSYIKIKGQSRWLGRFDSPNEAHAAYMRAAHAAHGGYVRGVR